MAIAAATALLATAACASDDTGDGGGNGPSEPDQVTYLTAFGASAHDAFVFMALENGHFEDANIDITIELGGGPGNYQALLAGQADFTYVDFTGMLIDLGRGELDAADFVALSAVHHHTLVAILAPADAGISSPVDLEGKLIGAFAGSPTELLLPAYAELSGWEYDEDLVELSDVAGLFQLLAAGQVDALSTFIIQQGVIENIIGGGTVAFPFNEYLDDLLGTGLITSARLAEEDPELAERFRDAALQGLRDTLADPEGAIEVLAQHAPAAVERPEPLIAQIRMMEDYIVGEGDDRIGVLDEAHIMRAISVLASAGLIPTGMDPDAIVGDVTLVTSSS
jgi:NitT/TauT family transport system substrate-binding protein